MSDQFEFYKQLTRKKIQKNVYKSQETERLLVLQI